MKYSTFEKTGEKVSLLGFGNMRLPCVGDDDAAIDFAPAKALLDAAYAGGVNYFDTAWSYHGGASEAFVRKALADKPRDSYFLATKLPMWHVDSQEKAMTLFQTQLDRLGTEYVDFYLFHSMGVGNIEIFEKYGLYQLMDEQRKAGKIRHLGFSFHDTPEVLQPFAAQYQWDFAQVQYNYFDAGFTRAEEQCDVLRRLHIPIVVMEPVRGGRLADMGPQANAPLLAENPAASIASWGMRWAANRPGVLTVLSGMSAMGQVQDNLATFAACAPLSAGEEKALEEAKQIFTQQNAVPCTGCRYCMPCPAGVNIPDLFTLYNRCAYDGSWFGLRGRYEKFPQAENAGNCVACKQCEAACPQHLPISEWMKKIDAAASPQG